MALVDIPADILASLVCSKCEQLLKKGPVYQQHDGAAVCGLCQALAEAQPASRCHLYEATAQLLRFPCRYQEEGCPTTVPFVTADSEGFTHEDNCEYRQYTCPVLGSNRCDWAGRRNQLHQHCEEDHSERILSNPAQLTPDIRRSQVTDYVIRAFKFIFLLHTRVCVSTAKLHYAVRLLGDPQLASKFSFTVTIRRGDNLLVQSRDVLPQELLVLQEHSALNLCTNSLLRVLGGWDGASLSVEVKAREPQAESEQEKTPQRSQSEPEQQQEPQRRLVEPEQQQTPQRGQTKPGQEQCVKCGECTTRFHRYRKGWLCTSCAPEKMCRNEGCNYLDYGGWKMKKHSNWLCKWLPECPFKCLMGKPPGTSLQQHKTTCTKAKEVQTGATFLVPRSSGDQYFLMQTPVGHVICACEFTEDLFTVCVFAPVPCQNLHLYRCEVRLEDQRNKRIYKPCTEYDNILDWTVEDSLFKNSEEVYVRLQIIKIE